MNFTSRDGNERIIPTRMGTSREAKMNNTLCKDHPHAYGDKPLVRGEKLPTLGSSPRVWGQGIFLSTLRTSRRIIPTRMGTRITPLTATMTIRDHPHAYGDKFTKSFNVALVTGSSPRVWGQDYIWHCINLGKRIIPTRMGTSTKLRAIFC